MHQHADAPRPGPLRLQRSTQAEEDRLHGDPGAARDSRGLTVLQQAAGNRAVARLLAPTVQRCGARGCPEQVAEPAETSATQGMEGVVEETPLMSEQVVQRATDGPPQPLGVQRVATWAAGAVHETNNLANTVFGGAPVGRTTPVMNGTITTNSGILRSALVAPTVTTAAAAAGGFEAEINTVPTNTGSFDETVLSAGPWRTTTTKADFHALFPSVAGCGGSGDTRFRAFGDPDDAAMFAANRRHEDHHATDIRDAFNDIIVPWDQKVTAAKAARTKFTGATAAAAEAALWSAMGGTPTEIADAFATRVVAASNAFHATPRGGNVKLSTTKNPGAHTGCSISFAFLTNPS